MYIAEIAPPASRGFLVSFNEFFINVGIPVAYLVNFCLANIVNEWRWMVGLGVVPAVLMGTFSFHIRNSEFC